MKFANPPSALDINSQKSVLRTKYKEIRKSISDVEREALDKTIFEKLFLLGAYKNADTVLLYYPYGSEINTLPIANAAQSAGKTVAFPISYKETRTLVFHAVTDIQDMTVGEYGICEPQSNLPKVTDFKNTLCIVPALSFDKCGHRLGYGGGYYDRFLKSFNGTSIILGYDACLDNTLPLDGHDMAVNIVITEKEEHR